MKPKVFLRIASIALFIILAGHSVALIKPLTRGPEEAAVFEAMKNFNFEMMGFTRNHYIFYEGYSAIMTVNIATIAVVLWLLSRLTPPLLQALRSTLLTLAIGMSAYTWLCWSHFFTAPAVSATIASLSLWAAAFGVSRSETAKSR